uniref:PRTRC system ThiF family protein n=1 Tax=uncultured Bacteroides sp. TaxID=162156 RepID=UPI0025FCF22B|nr:PRTRC system ThiF family protein [uncultured Bacteroides sp.]
MKRIHYTDNYLLKPYHPVTVFIAGAGGTGSQVITNLARMSMALQALGHPGLHVTVFDPDTVSEANIGRQLFSESELGQNKAVALVTRINRFFGYTWMAEGCRYPLRRKEDRENPLLANIIITCTDNIRSRLDLWKFLKNHREININNEKAPLYWMDFGNAQATGQVLIGNIRNKIRQPISKEYIPTPQMNVITEEVSYSTIKEKDSGPSCSLAEALNKQDLYINSMLAQVGCEILWTMFKEGSTLYRGAYVNLKTLRVNPIPV